MDLLKNKGVYVTIIPTITYQNFPYQNDTYQNNTYQNDTYQNDNYQILKLYDNHKILPNRKHVPVLILHTAESAFLFPDRDRSVPVPSLGVLNRPRSLSVLNRPKATLTVLKRYLF